MRVKGLFVKDIIKFCRSNFDVKSYLPIYRGRRAPDREWLANLGRFHNNANYEYRKHSDTR